MRSDPPDLRGLRIETDRLVLRPVAAQDFEGWAAFFADPQATAHLGGQRSRAMAWRHFLAMAGAWSMQGFGAFSLVEKASGRWIGWTGPWHPPDWPGGEVGWCLAREAWGNGYATEAATAAINWVFAELEWPEVIHLIAPEHVASQAVAQRLGSRRRQRIAMPAPFEGKPVDIWGQTRQTWQARREH
jgi:RimJ/RimL family protein N-acetyltransferase